MSTHAYPALPAPPPERPAGFGAGRSGGLPADAPSPWVLRWQHLIAPGATVLDVAAGTGRHTLHLSACGHTLTWLDASVAAREHMLGAWAAGAGTAQSPPPRTVLADIEAAAWPLSETFAAVVVTNYLWRGNAAHILASLAPGGVLLWETFSTAQMSLGRPRRPEFLLQPGELLRLCTGMQVVAFEDGFEPESQPHPSGRWVQRIAALAGAA